MGLKTFAQDILDFISDIKDSVTESVKYTDVDHTYVHDEKLYSVYIEKTITAGVTSMISIVTPNQNNAYIHWRSLKIASDDQKVSIKFSENCSSDTAGTTLNPINHNRNSSKSSYITIKDSANITTEGTVLDGLYLGGGGGGAIQIGDSDEQKKEFVLAPSTNYKIGIHSITSDQTIYASLRWYEEDDY